MVRQTLNPMTGVRRGSAKRGQRTQGTAWDTGAEAGAMQPRGPKAREPPVCCVRQSSSLKKLNVALYKTYYSTDFRPTEQFSPSFGISRVTAKSHPSHGPASTLSGKHH